MADRELVNRTFNSLIKAEKDGKFSKFAESLSFEQKIYYLYFEAKRSEKFVKELLGIDLDDIVEGDVELLDREEINNPDTLKKLLFFRRNFGELRPPRQTKISVIKKYEAHSKPLTELEKDFFREG